MRRTGPQKTWAALALAVILLTLGAGVAVAQYSSATTASTRVTTLSLGDPGTASASTTDSCANITIDWTAAGNTNSYRVQVREGAGAWADLFVTSNVTQTTDSSGHSATNVTYRVFSRDASSSWEGPTPATSNPVAC